MSELQKQLKETLQVQADNRDLIKTLDAKREEVSAKRNPELLEQKNAERKRGVGENSIGRLSDAKLAKIKGEYEQLLAEQEELGDILQYIETSMREANDKAGSFPPKIKQLQNQVAEEMYQQLIKDARDSQVFKSKELCRLLDWVKRHGLHEGQVYSDLFKDKPDSVADFKEMEALGL